MTHGHEDYAQQNAKKTTYKVLDIGEAAARLGAPNIYDRRGDVVFLESFEFGIVAFTLIEEGDGASVTLTTANKIHGGYGVKAVTGSTSTRQAGLSRNLPAPVESKVGVEVAFARNESISHAYIGATHYNKSDKYTFAVRYNVFDQTLEAYNSSDTWEAVASDIMILASEVDWNFFKLVVDIENKEYTRVLLNDNEIDVSHVDVKQEVSATAGRLFFEIKAESYASETGDAYFDRLIVTQNEP